MSFCVFFYSLPVESQKRIERENEILAIIEGWASSWISKENWKATDNGPASLPSAVGWISKENWKPMIIFGLPQYGQNAVESQKRIESFLDTA